MQLMKNVKLFLSVLLYATLASAARAQTNLVPPIITNLVSVHLRLLWVPRGPRPSSVTAAPASGAGLAGQAERRRVGQARARSDCLHAMVRSNDMWTKPVRLATPSPVGAGMFVDRTANATVQPRRGDMFVGPTANTAVQPRRGGMKSRNDILGNAAPHAAPTGLAGVGGVRSTNMPPLWGLAVIWLAFATNMPPLRGWRTPFRAYGTN